MSDQKLIDRRLPFPLDVTSPMPVQIHGPSCDSHETPVIQPANGKSGTKEQDKPKKTPRD
jgi:hypothetical protein